MAWLVQGHNRSGMTPVSRHHWWRTTMSLTPADPGVDEHLFLCELLETGMTYDQLQVGNVACFELIARKLQHWEERYGERLQAASEGPHLAGVAEERRHFMGGELTRSAALVSPALQEYVADKLREESAVLKERRKGREERILLATAQEELDKKRLGAKGQPKKGA